MLTGWDQMAVKRGGAEQGRSSKPEKIPVEISLKEEPVSLSLWDWLLFYFSSSLSGRYSTPEDYSISNNHPYGIFSVDCPAASR